MKILKQQSRRRFIEKMASFLPGVWFLQSSMGFASEGFRSISSIYTIQIQQLNPKVTAYFRNNLHNAPVIAVLFPHIDQKWLDNYVRVRNHYLKDGRLIGAKRVLDHQSSAISFHNQWSSINVFHQYFREARLNELDKKFRQAGCQPELRFHSWPFYQKDQKKLQMIFG